MVKFSVISFYLKLLFSIVLLASFTTPQTFAAEAPVEDYLIDDETRLRLQANEETAAVEYAVIDQIKAYLAKNGANVNAKIYKKGPTLLMWAITHHRIDIFEHLIRLGADVSKRHGGWNALHFAVLNGSTSMVRALLRAGADVDVLTRDGWTPLMLAVYFRRSEIIQLLLSYNANIFIRNYEGFMALELAHAKEFEDIVDLLNEVALFDEFGFEPSAIDNGSGEGISADYIESMLETISLQENLYVISFD